MTDYIKREDAIEKFAGVTLIEYDKTTAESPYSLSAAEKFFADVPSADVVEVVRCKDCVYREVKGAGMAHWFGCRIMEHNDDDWYCSYGERAET